MREIAVEEIVKIVIGVLIGSILIAIIAGDGVKSAIETGITNNINKASQITVPEED